MNARRINDFLNDPENHNLLTEFFHSCINQISNYATPTYQQFSNIGWTEDEYNYILKLTLAILKNPKVCYLEKEKMPEDLRENPINFPEELFNCIKTRLDHFTEILMYEHCQKYIPIMTDFDWHVKMIVGSSRVASIRAPLLQLDMRIREKNSEGIQQIEMNEEELDNLIKTLESIK